MAYETPSNEIQEELSKTLQRRYPDLTEDLKNGKVFDSIRYSKENNEWIANVSFFSGQNAFSGIFRYKTRQNIINRVNVTYESSWHCVHDWND